MGVSISIFTAAVIWSNTLGDTGVNLILTDTLAGCHEKLARELELDDKFREFERLVGMPLKTLPSIVKAGCFNGDLTQE